MTERTAEEWGQIAMNLPGWEWLPGMGLLPLARKIRDNERFQENTGEYRYAGWGRRGHQYTHLRPSKVRKQMNLVCGRCAPFYAFFALDPDDPATEGCLVRLLGPVFEAVWYTGDCDRWLVAVGEERRLYTSLGRACIAAAEALGRWPGGEE